MLKKSVLLAAVKVFTLSILLACRAAPAPDAGFIDHSELLSEDHNIPFDSVWGTPDLKWKSYQQIYIAPVDTSHLIETSWWDHFTMVYWFESRADEAKMLAAYMQNSVREAFKKDSKLFKVLDQPTQAAGTLVLELALVEVVPTKVWLNTITYPFLGAVSLGSAAVEGRVREASTGKIIARFKDNENGQMSLISIADLTWHQHAKNIIDNWSADMVAVTNAEPGTLIGRNSIFTLKPW